LKAEDLFASALCVVFVCLKPHCSRSPFDAVSMGSWTSKRKSTRGGLRHFLGETSEIGDLIRIGEKFKTLNSLRCQPK